MNQKRVREIKYHIAPDQLSAATILTASVLFNDGTMFKNQRHLAIDERVDFIGHLINDIGRELREFLKREAEKDAEPRKTLAEMEAEITKLIGE